MPLEEYKKKRKFNKTPGPTGGAGDDNKLHFVVQKHAASHLHYDFRLELKGVLKSWAVPKGPSLDPEEKRLAMQVEDHPYDYRKFEGIIPKGQYGGGTVIIWDEGTYETPEVDANDKTGQEHSLTGQFYKGGILFNLHGKKLKGQFALIKDNERDEKSWYLLKVKDKSASKADVTKKDKSVVSGMTIEEMSKNPEAKKWQSNRAGKEEEEVVETPAESTPVELDETMLNKGTKSPMPDTVKPMLCTRIYEPFDNKDWIYELKLDGYRIVANVNKGQVILRTRELQDYTSRYKVVAEVLQSLKHNVVLDGEVVALNKEGNPDFSEIQNYKGQSTLIYYVFDLLWMDDYDLTKLSLLERKSLLSQITPKNETVLFLDHVEEQGIELLEVVKQRGLEGIVAKKKDSIYLPEVRSKSWLKLPLEDFKDYVIVGYTESEHGRPFSRIMFGEYRDGKLYYVYHTGGGISDKLLYSTFNTLKKIEVDKKPVINEAEEETPIHWVKPVIVGRFKEKKLEKTKSGKIRHPVIFLGIREDIEAKDVISEEVSDEAEQDKNDTPKKPRKAKGKKKAEFNEIEVWKQLHPGEEITETEILEVEGKEITLINFKKEYWQDGTTKLHVILYYRTIADYILPYLKDRPMGLNVVLDWAGGETKFIRNIQGLYPSWVNTYSTERKVQLKGKSESIDWVLCNDLATLIYMVNLGALDFHPWAARTATADFPDFIIIDLDPDKTLSKYLPDLIKTALATKKVLDEYKLTSFIKTSGKRGLHVLIPCEGINYDQSTPIAEIITKGIYENVPKISTIERSREHRGGKIYIDAYQNNYSDRLASVYSLRAYKQPTVSTPLDWSEVNSKLDTKKFRIDNVNERIAESGDLFKDIMNKDMLLFNSQILKQII